MTEDRPVTEVRTPYPIDTTAIKDPGLRIVVSYAASMGWNVKTQRNGSVSLMARDGTQVLIPTDTSVRAGFIETKMRNVVTHTEAGKVPTGDLVESILATQKVGPEIKRALRTVTGVGEPEVASLTKAADPKPIPGFRTDAPRIPPPPPGYVPADRAPAPAAPPRVEEPTDPIDKLRAIDEAAKPKEVAREPYIGATGVNAGRKIGVMITYEDGSKRWKCDLCSILAKLPQALSAHYNYVHVEGWNPAPRGAGRRAEAVKRLGPGKRPVGRPRKEKKPRPQEVVDQLVKLMGPFFDQSDVEELRAENEALRARVVELEGNLKALRDLIGGIK